MQNPMPSNLSVLLFKETDFRSAKTENLVLLEYPEGIFRTSDPAIPAVLETGCYNINTPFNEMLISANLEFDGDGSFTLEASLNDGKWLSFGKFSTKEGEGGSAKDQKDGNVVVDTDVIKIEGTGSIPNRLNIRITINGKAKIKLISFTTTDTKAADDLYARYGGYYIPSCDSETENSKMRSSMSVYAPTLPIRAISQFILPTERAARVCSPTCCSLAMRHAGIETDPITMERFTHDNTADLCGNWFMNMAGCGAKGVYAFATRLNSIYEAAEIIKAGIPIAASVKIPEGALPGFPRGKTAGHFILVKGITENGDFVVCESAAPSDEQAEMTYPGKEFLDVWFGQKQGLCYIITKDLSGFFHPSGKTSDIYIRPDKDSQLETQVLPEETISVIRTEGKWAYIRADEQQDNDIQAKKLVPYMGWTDTGSLRFSLPVPKINVKNTPGMEDLRNEILKNARKHLGCKYILGGRTSDGIDCSGLAGMAYQLCGIRLPRNAHGQWIIAKPVNPAELKPADLMFLTDSKNEQKIGHVMLYLGNGRLIEATINAGMVREISCEEKFGVPFDRLENGIMLPKGNKFYCGTVL